MKELIFKITRSELSKFLEITKELIKIHEDFKILFLEKKRTAKRPFSLKSQIKWVFMVLIQARIAQICSNVAREPKIVAHLCYKG